MSSPPGSGTCMTRCRRGPESRVRPGAQARFLTAAALLAAALTSGGCNARPRPLTPADLDADESQYVSRVLILERAKATLMVDPPRGAALADSLATAWGDSARSRTVAFAPADPERAQRVHELLLRLLASEQDSLLAHDGRRDLTAPWPAPADSVPGSLFPGAGRVRADD